MQKKQLLEKKRESLIHSLAFRILFIALILLVLPLFVHNIFNYWQEYQKKKENLFLTLKIVGDNKSFDVIQYIDSEEKFLSWISSSEINNDLMIRAQAEEKLSVLSYISLAGESLIFSKSSLIKEHPTFLSDLKNYTSFFYENAEEKILIVSVPVKREGSVIGYLISETHIDQLKNELFQSFTFPYPVDISFHENSLDPFSVHRKDEAFHNGRDEEPFTAMIDGKEYFIKRVIFPKANFSLFIAVLVKDIADLSIIEVIRNAIYLILFFVVFGGVLAFFLAKRMYRPVKHLLEVINKIFYHDLDARYMSDKMGFEINVVGQHFNQMIDSVIHYQSEVERFRLKQEAYKKELEIGREIQLSLFPKTLPSLKNIDIGGVCHPAKEVGGDFYDLFLINSRLIFCVADAAGKGVSACLYSLGIRSLVRSALSEETDLSKAIQTVNHHFHEDVSESGVFTTLWIGILDTNTLELTYSSHGHHPALLKREDEIIELNTRSNALGPFKNVVVEIKSIVLKPKDQLLLYTDGVIDRQNQKQEFYGYETIKAFLLKEASVSTKQLLSNFIAELDDFAKKEPLFDDLTLLALIMQ